LIAEDKYLQGKHDTRRVG